MDIDVELRQLHQFLEEIGQHSNGYVTGKINEMLLKTNDLFCVVDADIFPELWQLIQELEVVKFVCKSVSDNFYNGTFGYKAMIPEKWQQNHHDEINAEMVILQNYLMKTVGATNLFVLTNTEKHVEISRKLKDVIISDCLKFPASVHDIVLIHFELEKIKKLADINLILFWESKFDYKFFMEKLEEARLRGVAVRDQEVPMGNEDDDSDNDSDISESIGDERSNKTPRDYEIAPVDQNDHYEREEIVKSGVQEVKGVQPPGNNIVGLIGNNVIIMKKKNMKILQNDSGFNEEDNSQNYNTLSLNVNQINDIIDDHEDNLSDISSCFSEEDLNLIETFSQEFEELTLGFNDFTQNMYCSSQLNPTQSSDSSKKSRASLMPSQKIIKGLSHDEIKVIDKFCAPKAEKYVGFKPGRQTVTANSIDVTKNSRLLEKSFKIFTQNANKTGIKIGIANASVSDSGAVNAPQYNFRASALSRLKSLVEKAEFPISRDPPKTLNDIFSAEIINARTTACNRPTYMKKLADEFDSNVKFYEDGFSLDYSYYLHLMLKKIVDLKIAFPKIGLTKISFRHYGQETFLRNKRYNLKRDKFGEIKSENILLFTTKNQAPIIESILVNLLRGTGFILNDPQDLGGSHINSNADDLYAIYIVDRKVEENENIFFQTTLPIKPSNAALFLTWAMSKQIGIEELNICYLCNNIFSGCSSYHKCCDNNFVVVDGYKYTTLEFSKIMLAKYKKENSINDMAKYINEMQFLYDECYAHAYDIYYVGSLYNSLCFGKLPSNPAYYYPENNNFVLISTRGANVAPKIEVKDPAELIKRFFASKNFIKLKKSRLY